MSDKKTVYFVQNGEMHSSWIIGRMDIEVGVDDSIFTAIEVASNILTTDNSHSALTANIASDTKLQQLIDRPGRWFYLAGCQVVHEDDLYDTREDAAQAYKQYLLKA